MAPYDDWNRIDDDEEDELQDLSVYESKRDVVLFCIDCSESMLKPFEDETSEDPTCHLYKALDAAKEFQKRKVLVGPNDSVGILLFNTTRKTDANRTQQGSEIKQGTFLYQPIEPLSAPKIQELMQLLEASSEDLGELRSTFPPLTAGRVPTGDIFTSCNWVLRDGAPKTATKRIFLITDEDNPHTGAASKQLTISARTTLIDLSQAGVTVEPFFIGRDEKSFDPSKFYTSILVNTDLDDYGAAEDGTIPPSYSSYKINDLLEQMRIREIPKRALFSVPFHLANGFTVGVKGYGLITEQKKGAYKYFKDIGHRMEVATVKTAYVDEDRQAEADKSKIVYGAALGASASGDGDDNDESANTTASRTVKSGNRPFFTSEEIRSFRTLGLEPGIKLLGFKDKDQLAFEDNVKHSHFIYPDEMAYSGSKRTFSALLKSMIKKNKIGLALVLSRQNASPVFCAVYPQEEKVDETGCIEEPNGFHLIPLPFADDIREAGVKKSLSKADIEATEAASKWIEKLRVKYDGPYAPDSFPNPALQFHNAQLEATAFREEYDPETFDDSTLPQYAPMHKRAGQLFADWKKIIAEDPSADVVVVPETGSKRKAAQDVTFDEAEIRSYYDDGRLAKLRVDPLREFLKSKGITSSGKKDILIERVAEWFATH